jgi:hypothetical protein
VDVEVLLEVEVSELITFLDTEQVAELDVRVDIMLILEVVVLDIRSDELGDVGAAFLRTGRAAEERAESRGDVDRLLEDAYTSRFAIFTFSGALTTTTLVGHLLNLRGFLFEALGFRDELRNSFTNSEETSSDSLGFMFEADFFRSSGGFSRGGYNRSSYDRGNRGRRRSGRGSGLGGYFLSSLGSGGDRSGNNRGGNRGRGSGDFIGLLGDDFLGSGFGRGVHYT